MGAAKEHSADGLGQKRSHKGSRWGDALKMCSQKGSRWGNDKKQLHCLFPKWKVRKRNTTEGRLGVTAVMMGDTIIVFGGNPGMAETFRAFQRLFGHSQNMFTLWSS